MQVGDFSVMHGHPHVTLVVLSLLTCVNTVCVHVGLVCIR